MTIPIVWKRRFNPWAIMNCIGFFLLWHFPRRYIFYLFELGFFRDVTVYSICFYNAHHRSCSFSVCQQTHHVPDDETEEETMRSEVSETESSSARNIRVEIEHHDIPTSDAEVMTISDISLDTIPEIPNQWTGCRHNFNSIQCSVHSIFICRFIFQFLQCFDN